MKTFFQSVTMLLMITVISAGSIYANGIKKIKVYRVEKGKERYLQINESNIRRAAIDSFEISDTASLIGIENEIERLKKQTIRQMSIVVYMRCEITYKSGGTDLLVFEDSNNGFFKFGMAVYAGGSALEGMILFAKRDGKL